MLRPVQILSLTLVLNSFFPFLEAQFWNSWLLPPPPPVRRPPPPVRRPPPPPPPPVRRPPPSPPPVIKPTPPPATTTAKPKTTVKPTTTVKPATVVKPTTTVKQTTSAKPTTSAVKPVTVAIPTTTAVKPTTPIPAVKQPTSPPPPDYHKLQDGIPKSCPTVVKRREIRSYTPAELKEWINDTLNFRKSTAFETIISLHHKHTNFIHGKLSNVFLIWHRYFLFDYEHQVSLVNKKLYAQPYWCWAHEKDYGDPANSEVITKLGLGGNGNKDGTFIEYYNMVNSPTKGSFSKPTTPDNYVKGFCLEEGVFAKSNVLYPLKSCILRAFNENGKFYGKMGAFPSIMAVNNFMTHQDLYTFRSSIEDLIHAAPHNSIGGHMLSMCSPGDPLFFLHHGMIDYIFHQWQVKQNYYTAKQEAMDPDNQIVNDISNQKLYPYVVTCGKVMKIQDLCYTYVDYINQPPSAAQTATISNANRNFLATAAEAITVTADATGSGGVKPLIRREAAAKQQNAIKVLTNKVVEACQNLQVNPERSAVTSYTPPVLVPFNPKIKLVPLVNGQLPDKFVDIGSVGFMPPINNFWIELNNLNKTKVEANYNTQEVINDKLNSVPGFIPPGAPWNCDTQMQILYKSDKVLCIKVNGTAIASYPEMRDFNDAQGVALMKSYMLNSIISDNYWKPITEVAPILIPIVGTPFTENTQSALNMFGPRFAAEVGLCGKDFKGESKENAAQKVEEVVKDKLKQNPMLTKEVQVVNPMVIQARELQAVLTVQGSK